MKFFLTFSAYFLSFLLKTLPSQPLSPGSAELPAFFETLEDANQDGFTDFFDFSSQKREIFARNSLKLKENELIYVFCYADADKDGLLSKTEWKRFYKTQIADFLLKCDETRDFLLDFNEFRRCFLEKSLNFSGNIQVFERFFAKNSKKITFLQALRLRDAAIAWKNCTKNAFSSINSRAFACMLPFSLKGLTILDEKHREMLFFVAKRLTKRSLQRETQGETLEFVTFWNLLEKFVEFSRFQRFLNGDFLEKSRFRDFSGETYGFPVDFAEFFVIKE